MDTRKPIVTLLIPCHNEEQSLPILYREVTAVLSSLSDYRFELFFVDDGSMDGTLEILKSLKATDSRVSYVSLSRNFGKENAMLAGMDRIESDCVILMDADLQDPPSLIPEMLRYWQQGYQDVYARRISRGRESWLRRRLSLLFYKILASSTKFEMLQNVGDFRLLDRRCVDAVISMRETERYTKGLFCWIGYKKKELLFNRGNRIAGSSKWSLWSLLNLATEGITSFTTAPLRIASICGFFIAMMSFVFLLYYLIKTLVYGDPVQGFPTLVTIILFIGGIQLLCLGILGEYIGRIYNETKQRPPYLINESSRGTAS